MDDERRLQKGEARFEATFEEARDVSHGAPGFGHDDPVLAALRSAPVVQMTEQERALLDELGSEPIQWVKHEDVVARLGEAR